MGIDGDSKLTSFMRFTHPVGQATTSVDFEHNDNGWVHACIVYDGTFAKVYINGAGAYATPATGDLAISHCPFALGMDKLFGNFTGIIDEVLMCAHAMTAIEVRAHYEGNRNYLSTRGLIRKI